MPSESATEFRPYRRALQAILASVTVGAILYLLASIAIAVFSKHPVRLRRPPISAENLDDLLSCQSDVERLFRDINEHTFEIQAQAARRDVDLAQHWSEFSANWEREWRIVQAQCRFVELSDRGLGVGFDRLAHAHEALEVQKNKFAAMMRNYIDDQVPHIEEIRRSLEASRRGLESQRRAKTPPQADGARAR